jgi:hypothetical protein
MSIAWIVIEIFVNIVEVGTMFYLFCRKFSPKYRTSIPTLLFMTGCIAYLSLPFFIPEGLPPVEIIIFICYITYLLLFRNGNIWKKIF